MADIAPDLDCRERWTAMRLSRLFRIERAGGFERRRAAAMRRLIERRGALVAELIALDDRRRAGGAPGSAALVATLAALAGEVMQSRDEAETRLASLLAELRLRRGDAPPTGVRGDAGGRLLGRG